MEETTYFSLEINPLSPSLSFSCISSFHDEKSKIIYQERQETNWVQQYNPHNNDTTLTSAEESLGWSQIPQLALSQEQPWATYFNHNASKGLLNAL